MVANHVFNRTFTTVAPSLVSNAMLPSQSTYAERLQSLRQDRPRLRQQFIKEKRMNPDHQIHMSEAVTIVGICQDMCPEFERVRRIVEDDLKLPEYTPESLLSGDRKARVPDESRMVKAYQRPAAGMDSELISDIRPPVVCLKTMKYMIERIDQEGLEFLHGWLWDRTRAVRKDLRTCPPKKPEDIALYLDCIEQCSRLYLIFLHHMAASDNEDYSHQQDVEQFQQASISLKQQYDDNRRAHMISANEAEFQAYRLIISLYTGESLEHEMHRLPENLRRTPRLQTAMMIFRAGRSIINKSARLSEAQQNWKAFWNVVSSPSVSYLMACAAELSFEKLRHIVLDTIYRAYRQGNAKHMIRIEDWTIPALLEVLGLDSEEEVEDYCGLYGFSFDVNADGERFLDTNSVAFTGRRLPEPDESKSQIFSERIVEQKRHNRLLSAVIQGMSVKEAKNNGLVVESELTVGLDLSSETKNDAEDSLFVPESSLKNSTHFTAGNFPKSASGGSSDTTSKLSPFANPFQTNGNLSTNPFQQPGSFPQQVGASTSIFSKKNSHSNPFTTTTQSSSPSPSENTLRITGFSFGKPSVATSSFPSSQASTGPAFNATALGSSRNLDAKPNAQSGLFNPSRNAIIFKTTSDNANTLQAATDGSPFTFQSKPVEQSLAHGTTSWSSSPKAKDATGTFPSSNQVSSAPGFSFVQPILPGSTNEESKESPLPSAASISSVTAQAATPNPPKKSVLFALDDEQQKAQEEQQQRQAQELHQRRALEEQERHARENEERRVRAEQTRLAQEEQRRLARLERERQAREEQERAAAMLRRRQQVEIEKDEAWISLTKHILLDERNGLLKDYIENRIQLLFPSVKAEVEQEKATKLAEEMYTRKKTARIRAVLAHWYQQVQKKKRVGRARNRRQWLKENAARLVVNEGSRCSPSASVGETNRSTPQSSNRFKKPAAPTSVRQAQEPKPTNTQNPAKAVSIPDPVTRNKKRSDTERFSTSESSASRNDVIALRRNSTAPVDRTETDWFQLRARGLDPSKYRKRSYDSDSEEEVEQESERKRARTSASSTPTTRTPLPPPTTDEERLARFRAVRDALNRPGATQSPRSSGPHEPPPHQTRQRYGNGHIPSIITQARAIISGHSPPQTSPQIVQRELSRSVPDVSTLSMQPFAPNKSNLGQGIGNLTSNDRPAYWARNSHFVPRHLYGKGGPAIRTYFRQSRGGDSTAPSVETMDLLEPLELSSPIPTQQSYIPEQETHYFVGEDEDDEDNKVDEADGEDEDEDMEDSGLEYEEEAYDEPEQGYDVYDEYEEYEEEEEEEEEGMTYEPQNAQIPQSSQFQPGGTQDDAIELSD